MNKLILDTLKTLPIPVSFQVYTGTSTSYCTFSTYLEKPEQFADDEEILTGFYVQLDLFSKGNYSNYVKQIKDLMKQANFTRTYETELYEDDTKLFHKVLRFYYAKNTKE